MAARKKAPAAPAVATPAGWHDAPVRMADGRVVPGRARASRALRVSLRQADVAARPAPGQTIAVGDLAAIILAVTDPGGRGEAWDITAAVTEG